MGYAVRISNTLVDEAKICSKVESRSITGQIEHWAKIGKIAEENPDLTYSLIKDILIGMEELESGQGTEYKFGWDKKSPLTDEAGVNLPNQPVLFKKSLYAANMYCNNRRLNFVLKQLNPTATS